MTACSPQMIAGSVPPKQQSLPSTGMPHPPMTSLVLPEDEPTAAVILSAAVQVMATRGYHGTSVRDIAVAAGVSPGSLYNHFSSKQDLLVTIMNRAMDGLITATEQALFDAPNEPVARLKTLVRVHVGRHAVGRLESQIGNFELRSLNAAALELTISKRDAQQRMFDRVVRDGVARGVFHSDDPRDAARFIVSACTAVAIWFKPGGRSTVEEVIERYQRVALDTVGFGKRTDGDDG